jgi:hypothetical protein
MQYLLHTRLNTSLHTEIKIGFESEHIHKPSSARNTLKNRPLSKKIHRESSEMQIIGKKSFLTVFVVHVGLGKAIHQEIVLYSQA